jgi:DMSO/TMAO reductase YedYZ heme-binding membrane subunit
VLGVIHFWMAVKKDISDPLTFATIFAALGAWRLWKWRARAVRQTAAHQ